MEVTAVDCIKLGKAVPIGGTGGNEFDDEGLCKKAKISEITVKWGRLIDSISIGYTSGETVTHGGKGGKETLVISLSDNEYITGISGKYVKQIDSMTITTNIRSYPPAGGQGGKEPYSLSIPGGSNLMVNGFFGRSDSYLDAIGIMCVVRR